MPTKSKRDSFRTCCDSPKQRRLTDNLLPQHRASAVAGDDRVANGRRLRSRRRYQWPRERRSRPWPKLCRRSDRDERDASPRRSRSAIPGHRAISSARALAGVVCGRRRVVTRGRGVRMRLDDVAAVPGQSRVMGAGCPSGEQLLDGPTPWEPWLSDLCARVAVHTQEAVPRRSSMSPPRPL